jgi:hypothetical protein
MAKIAKSKNKLKRGEEMRGSKKYGQKFYA